MFTYWKTPYESTRVNPRSSDLTDVSPKDFFSLAESLHCENSPVTGEMMLEYMVERKREAIFKSVSIENVIRMAYDRFIRGTNFFSGEDYLRFDRAHCAPEQLEQLRKIAVFKDKLHIANYEECIALCESAVFEICRRNDAELLKIYLDEFNGLYPTVLYDAVFDYYIYMYLPEWDLLKQYNDGNKRIDEFPGCCNDCEKTVSRAIQQEMLNVLILQAEKCGVPRPEALQILFEHDLRSCRGAFPIREQCVHLGTEFSNRDVYNTDFAERILFHYDDKDLTPANCIDPEELNDLFTDSCCALPVTCTCGDEGCGGIRAVSESWVLGNEVRLYIPIMEKVYYFRIEDRIALKKELLMVLEHALSNVRKYKAWCKKNTGKYDNEDDPILPYGTTSSYWRKLCKEISKSLPETGKKTAGEYPNG